MARKEEELYFEPNTEGGDPWECATCGRKYWSAGLVLDLNTKDGEGEVRSACGLCGECLSMNPKDLASLAHRHARFLKASSLHPNDEEDFNIVNANALVVVAGKLAQLDDFNSIPMGAFALKIGEAYQVLGKPWKPRKRKAA